jgi:hypothetical protein
MEKVWARPFSCLKNWAWAGMPSNTQRARRRFFMWLIFYKPPKLKKLHNFGGLYNQNNENN